MIVYENYVLLFHPGMAVNQGKPFKWYLFKVMGR